MLLTEQTPVYQSVSDWQNAILQHPAYQAIARDPFAFDQAFGGLESPFWIPNLLQAVVCLDRHIKQGSRIRIIGDRDVDGVSSTALIAGFLRQLYQKASREESLLELVVSDAGDDYGLSGTVLSDTLASDCDLVILLDMGSTHGPEIRQLKESQKEIIVLDHHQLHDRLPATDDCILVNPNLLHSELRETFLHRGKVATAGLVFKLLFGYALYHTSEIRYILQYSDQSQIQHQAFCGLYLGQSDSEQTKPISEALQFLQERKTIQIVDLDHLEVQKQFNISRTQMEWIQSNPILAPQVLLALAITRRHRLSALVCQLAELAAVGLLADMVPISGENRAIVRIGLKRSKLINIPEAKDFQNPGLLALIKKLQLAPGPLGTRDVGWSIAPAINAAGRMDQTSLALELLLSPDLEKGRELATQLVALNQKRKLRTSKNEGIIRELIQEQSQLLENAVLFCYHPELEKGVSGIVATRLCEKYKKPTIYIHRENDQLAKGSARTWNDVHVLQLIDRYSDLFIQFGGHPEAAGFSLPLNAIDELQARLASLPEQELPRIANQSDTESHFVLAQHINTTELLAALDRLEPFGDSNPEPVFVFNGIQVESIKTMSHGIHAKFKAKNFSRSIDFVIWHQAQSLQKLLKSSQRIKIKACLERNFFAGRSQIQFRLQDFEPDQDSSH